MSTSTTARQGFFSQERLSTLLSTRKLIPLFVTIFVSALCMIPLFFLFWDSFKDVYVGNLFDPSLTNFTLKNYREVLADPRSFGMLGDSFIFAFGAIIVAFFFGGAIAFLVERTNTPFRNIYYGLMYVPLVMPSMLNSIGWILYLSPTIGLFNKAAMFIGFPGPIFNAYSLPAMCWVQGLSMSPLTFLMLGAALRAMDPSLEEAAYTSGAGKLTTIVRITLRLMTPALAGIWILQFVGGLEAFEVPLLMGASAGIHVFSTNIYFAARELNPPEYGNAFVYAITIIIIGTAGLMFSQRMMGRAGQYATVTGKGYRPRLIDLGKWRFVSTAFTMLFLVFSTVLPFLMLLYASFLPYYQVPSARAISTMSWNNYATLLGRSDFVLVIKNTLTICGIVSISTVLLALMISWIVIRMRPKGAKILDFMSFIPRAIPGIATGFAFMVVFLIFPNPIYGSIWIIVLAYMVSFLPVGTRFTHAGIAQLKAELEEAAAASGAGLLTIFRRIIVPLLLPSLIAGGLYCFLLSAKVLSAAAILYTPDTMLLSVMIFQLWNEGSIPLVGTLAVFMITFLTILTIASRLWGQRRAVKSEVG